jgi:hypothetical protein
MQGSNTELLATGGDVLGGKHGSVGGGLVAIGFAETELAEPGRKYTRNLVHFHSTRHAGDGFAATGITQNISL